MCEGETTDDLTKGPCMGATDGILLEIDYATFNQNGFPDGTSSSDGIFTREFTGFGAVHSGMHSDIGVLLSGEALDDTISLMTSFRPLSSIEMFVQTNNLYHDVNTLSMVYVLKDDLGGAEIDLSYD
eukprot:UN25350